MNNVLLNDILFFFNVYTVLPEFISKKKNDSLLLSYARLCCQKEHCGEMGLNFHPGKKNLIALTITCITLRFSTFSKT